MKFASVLWPLLVRTMKNILHVKILDHCTHILEANLILPQPSKRADYYNLIDCRTQYLYGSKHSDSSVCCVSGEHWDLGNTIPDILTFILQS